ncbi:MAG: DUF5104 domain-containing protein [Lachnospiraceae bacterium]|nr:DUF5104 domain-containing protein [Lachnospiraceae bacterium]
MNSNKRRIRRLGVAIMIGLLSLSVTSCGMSRYVDTIKNSVREYQKKKRENDIQTIVMNAIINKDVEPIYRKLSPKLKKRHDTKKKIKELFDAFESDVVEWHRVPKEVMSESVSDCVTVEEYDAWTIDNIKTKSGKKYMLIICMFSVSKNEPENKGIYVLELHNANTDFSRMPLYSISGWS